MQIALDRGKLFRKVPSGSQEVEAERATPLL